MNHAIWAEGLVKRFGETTALAGVEGAPRLVRAIGTWGLSPFRDIRPVSRETAPSQEATAGV